MKNNPKFALRHKGGEDAYVISESQRMVGVCDGVGGWSDHNICSGKFSKFLCNKMGELYEADQSQSLKEILVEGVKQNPHGGSTTACLAKLEKYRT